MLFCIFLLVGVSAVSKDNFDAALEPGHAKQVYDSVEEVKSHENVTTTEKPVEDEHLLQEAILDVAYYLRRFKFSGFDFRYLKEGEIPQKNLFANFPSPPLRNIHWEVKKHCESSFVECLKYLQEQVSQTVLPRHLDSLTLAKQNEWSFVREENLIKQTDEQCRKLLEKDGNTFTVFSGPLQRFQWLTSASYYMCHFTMMENSYLKFFSEECDNFASCISWDFGPNNYDIRADNKNPFACSLYSFCPDPCCPVKHITDFSSCFESNHCASVSSSDKTCEFFQKENVDFDSMIFNRWNISCKCETPGMQWESKSGMCVDVDECVELESACNFPSETCRNLPGSYKCVCSPLGYRNNTNINVCEHEPLVREIIFPTFVVPQNNTKVLSDKFHDIINKIKSVMSVSLVGNEAEPNATHSFV